MSLPCFRHEAEKTDQRGPQSGAAELSWPSAVGTRHCIIRVLIVVDREHGNEHIEMRGVLDVGATRVLGGLSHRLANRGLHFVGIGLRQHAVEIQVHGWLVDAIKTLQVSEGDQPVVAEAIGLIVSKLCGCADRGQCHAYACRESQGSAGKLMVLELSKGKSQTVHLVTP
jgi:hypothetical protein